VNGNPSSTLEPRTKVNGALADKRPLAAPVKTVETPKKQHYEGSPDSKQSSPSPGKKSFLQNMFANMGPA